MKIQGPHTPPALKPAREQTRAPGAAPTGGGEERDDRVIVSAGAQALAEARAPEKPDAARIAALRDALAQGTFVVDPRRIAETMVREER